MPPARRCSICSLDWPDSDHYDECPQCEEDTRRFSNASPMPDDEAKSLRLHLEFDKFYDEWDAKKDPARLDP